MKQVLCSLAAVLAVTAFATTADAQGRRGGGGGGTPEEIIDRLFESDENSDGKLSADELGERRARMLERGDEDGDGFLSKKEVTAMVENFRTGGGRGGEGGGRGGRGGGPGGGPGGQGGGPGGPPDMGELLSKLPFMKALDKNGDGKLSKSEIRNAVKALNSLDKDEDGTLTVEELMPDASELGGPGGRRGGRGGEGGRGGRGGSQRPERPERDK